MEYNTKMGYLLLEDKLKKVFYVLLQFVSNILLSFACIFIRSVHPVNDILQIVPFLKLHQTAHSSTVQTNTNLSYIVKGHQVVKALRGIEG